MHVFTSVVSNYIPKARVLASSLKKFHPDAKFHLILNDVIPEWLRIEDEPFDSIITIDELPIDDRKSWIFKHTLVELCTSVKGFAFQYIFEKYNANKIFYFDPDIVILSSLDDLLRRLDSKSILLTPHQVKPDTSVEAIIDNEVCSLRHGIYNLGFLAVRFPGEGKRFIDWWTERLRLFCYDDILGGLFTDQRWVDLAPAFFEDIDIVRDPVYNVATWNLTHRHATGSLKNGILINGRPICFYHFSGFDNGDQEIMLNKYGGKSPILRHLRNWYIKESKRMGQEEVGQIPWFYGMYDNGFKITNRHRFLYRSRQDLQSAFRNPFATENIDQSYFHWFNAETKKSENEQVNNSNDTVGGLRQQLLEITSQLNSIKRSRSWILYQTTEKIIRLYKNLLGRSNYQTR